MDIKTLIELRDKLNTLIAEYSDGYFYITVVKTFGNSNVEEHNNYEHAYEAIEPYCGDNGIPTMYTNNPKYINKVAGYHCSILSLEMYHDKYHCPECSMISYNARQCRNPECFTNYTSKS